MRRPSAKILLWIVLLCCTTQVVLLAQRKGGKKRATVVTQVNKEDLQAQRAAILEEISKTQAQLKALQKDKNSTVEQLTALQNKLQARQALINNINNEINRIEDDITNATDDVGTLKESLKDLQMHYGELIRYSYKQRTSQDMVMFIFSSKSFYDALRRYKYIKQYRDYRRQQAEKILLTSKNIKDKIFTLEQQRQEKDAFLQQQEMQRQALAAETNEKNSVVLDIKGKEKELLAKVASQKKIADNLNAAINAAIRREIALARKKAEEEARKVAKEKADRERREREAIVAKRKAEEQERKRQAEEERRRKLANVSTIKGAERTSTGAPKPGNVPTAKPIAGRRGANNTNAGTSTSTTTDNKPAPRYLGPKTEPKPAPTPTTTTSSGGGSYASDMSTENRTLSANFESNRGFLSSPASGYVCEHFGKNKHPVYNVVTENYGIDIRTSKGAQVKTVFDGEVSSVFFLAGAGVNIMINHGTYFTVYSKIDKALVVKGQKVSARQAIGTVMTDAEGNNQVHFEIWKVGANGTPVNVNPELWIRM
ncbi:MAG: hypothetical protein RL660_951 [Bacteroidota bacterium]